MSTEIIQLIRGSKHKREPSDFPTIAFRSAAGPEDLTMGHIDTAPCEYAPFTVKPRHDATDV